MKKKNLLIVTSTFPRWTNDTDPPFVYELAKRLTDSFNITVLTPSYPGALPYEVMEGIKVHRFRYFLGKLEILAGSEGILPTLKKNSLFYLLVPFFILAEFIALLKLSKNTKPDIIHAHWLLPQGLVAALGLKITGTPFIVTTHGGDIYGLQSRFASTLKSFVLNKAASVTVVSQNIQKTIKQKYGGHIHTDVIPMGVDSTIFNPESKDPQIREHLGIKGPFLLYVGRLSEKKGVIYLLKAMPYVLERFPDCRLLIIGTGELAQHLRKKGGSLNLKDKVFFIGAVPNNQLPTYFASADIFIGPSVIASGGDTEGFGLTFVEAAMSGCIVIGTNVGGISDIVEEGETGFIVPEKDHLAIAEILLKILQDDSIINSFKNKARSRMIKKFDWQVIAAKYAKILGDNAVER